MTKLVKNRDGNFTHVKNDIFDSGLSAKAMGLFTYMWHLPDNWQFYEDELVNHFKDGKASIRTGLKELEDYGFLERKQNHNESNGKFGKYDWQLNESPFCDYPKADKPKAENPPSENRTLQNTNTTKDVFNKILITTTSACLNFYKENVGNLPPIVSQQIQQYCNNMSPELVKEAIIRSVESGKSWRNAKGILESWQLKKVATLDDVKQDDEQFAKKKQPKLRANYGRPTINKKIPASMKEKYDPKKDKLSPEQKAETERMLAEFQRSAEND